MFEALFSTQNIKTAQAKPDALGIGHSGVPGAVVGGALDSLEAVVGTLAHNRVIHYVTYGRWSSHQLVGYILNQIGPARLWMTTWSMTETPLRQLFILKQKKLLLEARCILSDRIIERTPAVFDLAKHVFDEMKLVKLHAKVTVLMNDDWCVCVVGSANFTANPRVEAGVIDSHRDVGLFHIKWIGDELAKAKQ